MPSDWALAQAREWLHAKSCAEGHIYNADPDPDSEHAAFDELLGGGCADSLADRFDSVRADTLAEVRRIVEKERLTWDEVDGWPGEHACEEILKRLEGK